MKTAISPERRAQLQIFAEKVTQARRQAGRLHKDLAAALGLDSHVLSRKMHGGGRNQLTQPEVKQIIQTLAAWDAITSQTEAVELLGLVGLHPESFSAEEWNRVPLNRLEPPVSGGRTGTFLTSANRSNHASLPSSPTTLIGREWAVRLLCERLRQSEVRLLTLLGTGGVGKTRLSLAVARQMQQEFADGVSFISLASLQEASLVAPTIAQAFGLLEALPGQAPLTAEQRLKAFLSQQHCLLVLDNFEHLLPAASLVGELLEAAAQVKILVTSRAPLQLYGEYEFHVPPLEVPDLDHLPEPAALLHAPAVRLFVERARAGQPTFTLTARNAAAVAAICHHLEGLPLALELAAARMKQWSPMQLLERLRASSLNQQGQALSVLKQVARNVSSRQQTLVQTLDWSYQLLDARAQRLFTRLGVFVGGWTLEAAQAICQDEGEQTSIDEMSEQLETLVNQSLVVAVAVEDEESGKEPSQRFRLLEPVRDYALGHLQLSREREEVYRRLAHYYLSVTEQREPALESQALQGLMLEQGNIRAALEWALAREEAELVQRFCGVLEMFWEASGQFQEGQRWIEAALAMEAATPKQVQAKLLLAASRLAVWAMAYQRAVALAQQALTLYEACVDARGKGRARYQLGEAWYEQGEYARAIAAFEASLEVQRTGEDWPGYARTLTMLGAISMLQGHLPQAEAHLNEALAVLQKTGDPAAVSSILLGHLGIVALLQEHVLQALRFFKEALLRSHESGHRFRLAMELITMGCALGVAGEPCYAAQVCSAAEALLERLGTGVPLVYRPLMTTMLLRIQAQADKATWQAWWTQGRSLPVEQAVALALDGCQQLLSS